MNADTGLTPLGEAVWRGDVAQVKQMLKARVDPNGGSRPPLWVAVSRPIKNAGRIIDLLLEYGADPNKVSTFDSNTSPLLGAVKLSQPPAIISALIDRGANPTMPDDAGNTARGEAERKRDMATLKALQPRDKRVAKRPRAVPVITGLLLFVVAWSNKNVKVRVTAGVTGAALLAREAIYKRFNMSGLFDRAIPKVCRC